MPLWIMWQLWKNRNLLLFVRKFLPANFMVKKAVDEARGWAEVNRLMAHDQTIEDSTNERYWEPPCVGYVKCNVGVCWSRKSTMSGASWVVRYFFGRTIMHSRRTFSGVLSKDDA